MMVERAYAAQKIWSTATQQQGGPGVRSHGRGGFPGSRAFGSHGSRRDPLWRAGAQEAEERVRFQARLGADQGHPDGRGRAQGREK